MFNSAEHETLNSHKYKNIKKFNFIQAQISLNAIFELTVVGILSFINAGKFPAQLS